MHLRGRSGLLHNPPTRQEAARRNRRAISAFRSAGITARSRLPASDFYFAPVIVPCNIAHSRDRPSETVIHRFHMHGFSGVRPTPRARSAQRLLCARGRMCTTQSASKIARGGNSVAIVPRTLASITLCLRVLRKIAYLRGIPHTPGSRTRCCSPR